MPLSSSYTPVVAYTRLSSADGAPFFDPVDPASFPVSILRYRNDRAARLVGLDALDADEWLNHFARFTPLPDTLQNPVAIRYHGHQFRHYNRDIGDGRGFLFAQMRDGYGRLLDLGTKGSGQTPYSRSGDGRLTLKGGVREILATEMLTALGVYTSKTFSVIETGEQLYRGDEPSPARSCVLVRLSHSHVRFGIFQRLAYEQDDDAMNALVDYCIREFYPALALQEGKNRVVGLYRCVIAQTARLVAQWMAAGFVHGVLNTDNMNVTGESFDYGPWRFVPTADPGFTAAYFDQTGLYAYGRQAEAAGWNLAQLGGALSRIADAGTLTKHLQTYPAAFERELDRAFARRFGLARFAVGDRHEPVAMQILRWMGRTRIPFEQIFLDWFGGAPSMDRALASQHGHLYRDDNFAGIRDILGASPTSPEIDLDHPYFAGPGEVGTPCTMLIDEVEALWAPIADHDDWGAFHAKLAQIRAMGEALRLQDDRWPKPPADEMT